MKSTLDNDRPIFQQIKEMIEEDILSGRLKPDEQIPSNSRLVSYYGINPVTVHKGVTLLADEGLIYKKRGLGMFVAPDAPDILRKRHSLAFKSDYAAPLVRQARALGMSDAEIHAHIDEALEESPVEAAISKPQPADGGPQQTISKSQTTSSKPPSATDKSQTANGGQLIGEPARPKEDDSNE